LDIDDISQFGQLIVNNELHVLHSHQVWWFAEFQISFYEVAILRILDLHNNGHVRGVHALIEEKDARKRLQGGERKAINSKMGKGSKCN
jgi:hypothetical protein